MSSLYERRLHKSRLLSKPTLVLALRLVWVVVVIWCEFGLFFHSLSDCKWPDKALQSAVTPTHIILVADAQLHNPAVSAPGSWFGYDPNLAYLRKSWKVASRLNPSAVMFLGDTFASGRYVTTEAEYDRYYRAFETTFPRDASVPLYLIPGNNDIGLGDSSSFSKDARRFFEERFGPLNKVITIAGHQFVLLDAPGLVEEDYRRHAHGQTYDHWKPLPGGPIEFVRSISVQTGEDTTKPKILLSHIPLSRPSSKSCGLLREKGSVRTGAGHGYQTMLGKQTTGFLLRMLQPSVVFSGDNRDYCEVTHDLADSGLQPDIVREVTVKSFSPSHHIRRPGFQLLSLVPPSSSLTESTLADVPCQLPDTLRVFHLIYVPCFLLTALALLYANIAPSRHKRRFSNLSPISLTRYGRSLSPHEPESAIWTTRTPLKSRAHASPVAPLPVSSRMPSTRSVPSYRASPVSTPQDSPLLSPIALFPSGDERDGEEEYVGPSHYSLRRDPHYSGGWQGDHDHDDVDLGREVTDSDPLARSHLHPYPHAHSRGAAAPYFLPPPLSQRDGRAGWSWTFVFRGRRWRMAIGLPDWRAWRSWLGGRHHTHLHPSGRARRGLAWRFASDCVSVALPAVVAWAVIGWWFF